MVELTVEEYFKRLDAHEEASGLLDCRKAVVNNAKYKIKETFTPSKQLLNYMYSKPNRQHADELNASMTTITRIHEGKVSIATLEKIAEIMGVVLDTLVKERLR